MSSLQFDFDWIDMPGRAEHRVAATLARLTIRAGETIATQVFDKRARTVRDWIVTPLAPLAEWIAAHWWSLLEECVTPSRSTAEFEQRHLLRTAEEGFVLPSLRLLPEGDAVLVICEPRATRFSSVDYVSRGTHRFTSGFVFGAGLAAAETVLEKASGVAAAAANVACRNCRRVNMAGGS